MSRTDAHAPFHVRMARREVTGVPLHRCAGRDCDLPALDPGWAVGRAGRCCWEFAFTGRAVCPCRLCHWHHRPQQRRAAGRVRLWAAAREWNAGDGEAGWQV